MIDIQYRKGDATNPILKGYDQEMAFIMHICNDEGGWGRGFVVALSNRWSLPEKKYRDLKSIGYQLGTIQMVSVEDNIHVVNMIAQHGIRHSQSAPIAVRYDALAICLRTLSEYVTQEFPGVAVIHCPRIGTGLGGGDWKIVESLIISNLSVFNIPVVVYDL